MIQERLNDFAAISSTYRIKTTSKVDNIRCALPVTSITQIFARLNQLLAVCHHSNMSPRVTRSMKRLQNEKKKVTKKVTKKKKSKKNIQVESDDFLVEEGSISSRLSVEYEEDKPEESLSSASNCHPTFKRRLSHGPGSQSDIGESNAEDLSAIEEVDEDVDVDDHDDLDDGAEDVDDHDDLDDGAEEVSSTQDEDGNHATMQLGGDVHHEEGESPGQSAQEDGGDETEACPQGQGEGVGGQGGVENDGDDVDEGPSTSTKKKVLKKKKLAAKSSAFLDPTPGEKQKRANLGWTFVKEFTSEDTFRESEIFKELR